MKVLVLHEPSEAEHAELVHKLIRQWLGAFAEYRTTEVKKIEEPPTEPEQGPQFCAGAHVSKGPTQ